jgi:hypothetical protein
MTTVTPIIARRGEPRLTAFRDKISPTQVRDMFAKASAGHRVKVPDIDACGRLAASLSAMVTPTQTIALDLGGAAKLLNALPGALAEPRRRFERYAVPGSNLAPEVLARMNQILDAAAWLQDNVQPAPRDSWHGNARTVAALAICAWEVCCKPPTATNESGPLVKFVKAAMSLIGQPKSEVAVSAVLRGRK